MTAWKIYIIEDDVDDVTFLHEAFTTQGYGSGIHFFMNPECLIPHLDSLNQADFPHIIITDLNMPKVSGFQLIRLLKSSELYKGIPVVAYTTSILQVHKEMALAAGADHYYTKPTSFEAIKRFVKTIVELSGRNQAH
jgi:CheY-like chemotaxis protein